MKYNFTDFFSTSKKIWTLGKIPSPDESDSWIFSLQNYHPGYKTCIHSLHVLCYQRDIWFCLDIYLTFRRNSLNVPSMANSHYCYQFLFADALLLFFTSTNRDASWTTGLCSKPLISWGSWSLTWINHILLSTLTCFVTTQYVRKGRNVFKANAHWPCILLKVHSVVNFCIKPIKRTLFFRMFRRAWTATHR